MAHIEVADTSAMSRARSLRISQRSTKLQLLLLLLLLLFKLLQLVVLPLVLVVMIQRSLVKCTAWPPLPFSHGALEDACLVMLGF